MVFLLVVSYGLNTGLWFTLDVERFSWFCFLNANASEIFVRCCWCEAHGVTVSLRLWYEHITPLVGYYGPNARMTFAHRVDRLNVFRT